MFRFTKEYPLQSCLLQASWLTCERAGSASTGTGLTIFKLSMSVPYLHTIKQYLKQPKQQTLR